MHNVAAVRTRCKNVEAPCDSKSVIAAVVLHCGSNSVFDLAAAAVALFHCNDVIPLPAHSRSILARLRQFVWRHYRRPFRQRKCGWQQDRKYAERNHGIKCCLDTSAKHF